MTIPRAITMGALLTLCACRTDDGTREQAGADTLPAPRATAAAGDSAAVAVAGQGTIGCTRTDTPPPSPASETMQDLRGGARFTCVIHAGSPPVEVQVKADDQTGYVDDLTISAPGWTPAWSQSLDAEAEAGIYKTEPALAAIDYDRDGWGELRTQVAAGATGNTSYHIFRFDPQRQRFARDSVLSETSTADTVPGRPCVRGYMDAGGGSWSKWMICRESGQWVDTESESQSNPRGQSIYIRERMERRNGRMVVVKTDTLTEAEAWNR